MQATPTNLGGPALEPGQSSPREGVKPVEMQNLVLGLATAIVNLVAAVVTLIRAVLKSAKNDDDR